MPWYKYRCFFCSHEFEAYRGMEDRGQAPEHCGAPATRIYVMPYVSATIAATSRPETARALERDHEFAVEGAAYKRLRKDGLQPKQIDGSARLEAQADTKTEVEMGTIMRRQDVKDGVDLSSHMLHKDLEL